MRIHEESVWGWAILFIANVVAAASNTSCSTPTITSQRDADALLACSTITGSLTIASNAAGNLQINGVERIQGALENESCDGVWSDSDQTAYQQRNCTNLKNLSSLTLKSIGGRFSLQSLLALETVSFPQLSLVGSLLWYRLPVLSNVSLNNGITTLRNEAASVTISNAEQLAQLKGFSFTDLKLLKVNLSSVSTLQLPLKTADEIEIYGNGNLSLDLSALVSVGSLLITGCKTVTFHDLKSLDKLDLNRNTLVDFSIPTAATPSIASSISITENPQLASLSILAFGVVTKLDISLNPALTKLNLQTVSVLVSANINGNFSTLPFPNLRNAIDVAVNSSQSAFTCADLDTYRKNGTISGKYSCQGKTVAVSGVGVLRVSLLSAVTAGIVMMVVVVLLCVEAPAQLGGRTKLAISGGKSLEAIKS